MSQKTTPEAYYALVSTDPQFRGLYDEMHELEKNVPNIEGLFLSKDAYTKIAEGFIGLDRLDQIDDTTKFGLVGDLNVMWVHYIWNKTRGIYRFDEDLLESLVQSRIEYPIPARVFEALPEPCMVIRVPEGYFEEGFRYVYAMIERHNKEEDHLLIVLHDGEDEDLGDQDYAYYSFPFLNGLFDPNNLMSRAEHDASFMSQYGEMLKKDKTGHQKKARQSMQKVIPLLLYMCEYQPDIERVTPEKAIRSDPGRAVKYTVGNRAGTILRTHKKVYIRDGHLTQSGKKKSPHYRRPYFRIQNYGPRPKPGEKDQREKRTIWIHGCFVNKNLIPEEGMPTRNYKYTN